MQKALLLLLFTFLARHSSAQTADLVVGSELSLSTEGSYLEYSLYNKSEDTIQLRDALDAYYSDLEGGSCPNTWCGVIVKIRPKPSLDNGKKYFIKDSIVGRHVIWNYPLIRWSLLNIKKRNRAYFIDNSNCSRVTRRGFLVIPPNDSKKVRVRIDDRIFQVSAYRIFDGHSFSRELSLADSVSVSVIAELLEPAFKLVGGEKQICKVYYTYSNSVHLLDTFKVVREVKWRE